MPETPTQSFDAGDNGSEDIKEGHPQSLPKTKWLPSQVIRNDLTDDD